MLKLDIWTFLPIHRFIPLGFLYFLWVTSFYLAVGIFQWYSEVILYVLYIFIRYTNFTVPFSWFVYPFFFFLLILIMLRFQVGIVDGICYCCRSFFSLSSFARTSRRHVRFFPSCTTYWLKMCVKNDVWWELGVFSRSCHC